MNTLPSSNVRIFPASNRSTESQQFGTNFVTEYNLSSIINKLMYNGEVKTVKFSFDEKTIEYTVRGFLISDSEDDNPFEFNIGGYFVSISGATSDEGNAVQLIINQLKSNSDSNVGMESFVKFICIPQLDDTVGIVYAYIDIVQDKAAEESFRYIIGIDGGSATAPDDSSLTYYALPLFSVKITTSEGGEFTIQEDPQASLYWQSQLRLTNFAIDDGDLDK